MIGLELAVYENVFATRQIRRQPMSALDVRHEFDLGDFERAQIDFGDAVVGFVIYPEPMAIVAAVGLTQHWMMSVAPEWTGFHQSFKGLRAGIIGITKTGTRLEDRDLLDEPARWNAIDKHAAALTAAQNRIVVVQLARWDVHLLRGGTGLRGCLLLFRGGVGVASREYERRRSEENENEFNVNMVQKVVR